MQEEKWKTEDEMVGQHHQVDGYELEQAPGAGDGQGSLDGMDSCLWHCKEMDTREGQN